MDCGFSELHYNYKNPTKRVVLVLSTKHHDLTTTCSHCDISVGIKQQSLTNAKNVTKACSKYLIMYCVH